MAKSKQELEKKLKEKLDEFNKKQEEPVTFEKTHTVSPKGKKHELRSENKRGVGAPKGHPNYNTSKDPLKNGAAFGIFGRPDNYYTDEKLIELSNGLLEWIKEPNNIWMKYYFLQQDPPLVWEKVVKLAARFPTLNEAIDIAKQIQESKLVSDPYDMKNKKDAYHARWILARHHKGDWEDKKEEANETQTEVLDQAMKAADHLQKKADESRSL